MSNSEIIESNKQPEKKGKKKKRRQKHAALTSAVFRRIHSQQKLCNFLWKVSVNVHSSENMYMK